MRVGLVMAGSLDAFSGDHLYDRHLVDYLRSCDDSVEVFSLPHGNYARQLVANASLNLGRRLQEAQLDVLLQNESLHPALLRLNGRLRRQAQYPIVSLVQRLRCLESHSPGAQEFYRWIERQYLMSVAGFICHSETTQRAVCSVLDRPELAQSVVANPGGDRFLAGVTPELIQQRAHERGPLRLVFVGEAIKRKGLLILLEALLQLPQWACQLTVVGNTDVDALYMRVVYHLLTVTQLTGVSLAGTVGDAELATILARSHVLVVPSEYEGSGTAYLEGMNFGLPAIGTTSGVAQEFISDDVNGYLVPPNDPAALAARLASLATDRGKVVQLSLAARERFLAQPGWAASMACVRQALLSWLRGPASQN